MSEPSQPNPGVAQDVSQKYDSELSSPPIQREVPTVSAAELRAGANERAQQRPLLQKIVAAFKKEKGSYRELIINSEPLEKRVALLVDGRLEKFEIERESDDRRSAGSTRAGSRTWIRACRPRLSTSATRRTPSCTTGT